MKKLLIAIPLASVLSTVSISPTVAIPYNGNTVYRGSDRGEFVTIFSGTPNSVISVGLKNNRPISRVVGSCGEIRISANALGAIPPNTITVNGTSIDISTFPTYTTPACIGGSFADPVPTNFKTPNGGVVLGGRTAGTAVTLLIERDIPRSVLINACGFGILKSAPPTFNYNGTSRTYATLPNANKAPKCINDQAFVPQEWLTP
ncbi:hypothetical protein [Cylindrospermopsis raciborskii]|uniref:hypothetical protein n=1 Tax=Cylindrospermopsis raciborskii TaxID=77022 RepID=UPI000C1C644C|nr:hypothetical protein [Cylindrospermopsis raciborskii]MCZ2203001.1 hypothetical protein [Cylindrospermopsis raciborskii PAMP2012]MCZ2207588.1 hypothetical protein [Cylindrospermopsis raciborskii PAMP2011]